MKSKLLLFALLLMGVSAGAQTVSVSISDDCSKNGVSKIIALSGSSTVSSTAGRTSCEWVQLWENGPKWATFNVGATITDYANLTTGADATLTYYNTANVGGLYDLLMFRNGRQTTWSQSSANGLGYTPSDGVTNFWGSNWRTPYKNELNSLLNNTTWTWCDGSTIQYVPGCTLKGYIVSGKGEYADKSIFLPATGYYDCYHRLISQNSGGYYWSRTASNVNSIYFQDLSFSSDNRSMGSPRAENGLAVRAVLVENKSTVPTFSQDSTAPRYYITGEGDIFGNWNPSAFELDQDYSFTRVLDAGYHSFKITSGSWDINWGTELSASSNSSLSGIGVQDGPNCDFNLEQTSIVTITFNPSISEICVTLSAENMGCSLTLYADGCSFPNTYACSFGQQVSMTATPMAHRHFVKWNDGNTDNPRLVTMNQSITYTATFAPDSFNISVSANPTTYGNVSGVGRYEYNDTATLSATANYGYKFRKWSDGNTDNPRIVQVTQDANFVAEFVFNQFQVTDGSDNTRGYILGAKLSEEITSFTVNLKDSYGDGWNGNKLTITDGTHSYTCTINSGRTASYTITYYGMPYTFYWTKGSDSGECSFDVVINGKTTSYNSLSSYATGDVVCVIGGGSGYDYLSEVELTAIPNTNYHFMYWSDGITENPRVFTIVGDTTFTAIFEDDFTIHLTCENGRISGGKSYYKPNDTVVLNAEPYFGYSFVQWSDGVTDNPRTIVVMQDSAFTAEMALDYEGVCGDSLTWKYSKGVLTISGTGDMYGFSYSSAPWINFRDSITKVVLPDGLTKIGNYAFYDCKGFTSIVIPNSVTNIGEYAFSGCSNLTTVSLGNGLTSIGRYAFDGCSKLRYITSLAEYAPTVSSNTFPSYNAILKVPCDVMIFYQGDDIWGQFKYIQCIEAEEAVVTTTTVVPAETDATFAWPTSEGANTYTLKITKDGVVFCTLTFNANGQLLNIAFAPGRDGAVHAPEAELTATGYQFTVTGLESGSTYAYTLDAKDAGNNVVANYSGTFTTTGGEMGVESVNKYVNTPIKVVREGQVLILRGDRLYDLRGQEVK